MCTDHYSIYLDSSEIELGSVNLCNHSTIIFPHKDKLWLKITAIPFPRDQDAPSSQRQILPFKRTPLLASRDRYFLLKDHTSYLPGEQESFTAELAKGDK